MLIVMIGIRKSLDLLFTRRELKILDDIMPEMSRKEAAADDLSHLDDDSAEVGIVKRMLKCCLGARRKNTSKA